MAHYKYIPCCTTIVSITIFYFLSKMYCMLHLFKQAFYIYKILSLYYLFSTSNLKITLCPCIVLFETQVAGASKRKFALGDQDWPLHAFISVQECRMCIKRFRVEAVMYSDSPLWTHGSFSGNVDTLQSQATVFNSIVINDHHSPKVFHVNWFQFNWQPN